MFKRRWLRILGAVLLVLSFTVYFAWSTFLFSPLEDDFVGDLSTLIPRDIDFYVSKPALGEDFGSFPPAPPEAGETLLSALVGSLAAGERLNASPALQTWINSKEFEASDTARTLESGLRDAQAALAQAPIAIDLLDVLGGRDLAIAGYLRGAELAQADWALYARINWIGKLAVSLLRYPDLLGLSEQGLSVQRDGEVLQLSGGALTRPLYLLRYNDVLVVSNAQPMMASAVELAALKGQDSFGQSARYADQIAPRLKTGEDLELFVDTLSVFEKLGITGAWPPLQSQDVGPALLGRLVQRDVLKELEGSLFLGTMSALELHGELASERMTPLMKKLYRLKDFERDQFFEVAKLAPADTCLFVYLHAGIGDLLRAAFESSDMSTQTLINDGVRSLWGYPDALRLADEIDAALRGQVALVVRPFDYPDEGEKGPPHDAQPVFAVALVTWVENTSKINDFRNKVIQNQGQLSIAGRTPGSGGVFTNTVSGGYQVHEYWSRLVPGTGHIASVEAALRNGQVLMVSNSHLMLGHLLKTYFEGGVQYPQLAERDDFLVMANAGQLASNAALWLDPRSAAPTLKRQALQRASDSVVIDWKLERPRLEQVVLKRDFGGRPKAQLNPEENSAFESSVDAEAELFELKFQSQHVPALVQKFELEITRMQLARSLMLQLALDPKLLDLTLRAIVPLDR